MSRRGWALGAVAALIVLVATAGGFLIGRRTPRASGAAAAVTPAARGSEIERTPPAPPPPTSVPEEPTAAQSSSYETAPAVETPAPLPTEPPKEPTPPQRTGESLRNVRPRCPEQAAVIVPKVVPLLKDFKDARETALKTPWLDISLHISKLEDIQKKTRALDEWPDAGCGYALREKLDEAESFDIQCFKEFLDSHAGCDTSNSRSLWADAERQLKGLQNIVAAEGLER